MCQQSSAGPKINSAGEERSVFIRQAGSFHLSNINRKSFLVCWSSHYCRFLWLRQTKQIFRLSSSSTSLISAKAENNVCLTLLLRALAQPHPRLACLSFYFRPFLPFVSGFFFLFRRLRFLLRLFEFHLLFHIRFTSYYIVFTRLTNHSRLRIFW